MSRKLITALSLAALLALALAPALVFAHETVKFGEYDVEYGWLNEPVIAGQPNAITLTISKPEAAAEEHSHETGISLTAPTDGAAVQGDHVDVAVAFEGLPEDASGEGIHWHLMVDGQVLSMVPLHQPNVTVSGLGDGDHTIEVSIADGNHGTLGHAASATITVTGGASTNAPSASEVEPVEAAGGHEHAAPADVDVSGLVVEVVYGSESKTLALEPVGENSPGEFVALLTPTRAGQFTLRLSGKIDDGEAAVVEVQPEEVQPADVVAFPNVEEEEDEPESEGLGLAEWLGIGGILLGLAGAVMGGLALARRK
jgi:hypothetical protein